jgi:hypothetical protein
MDPTYNGKPSMISETTFTRPNRFRTEAPIFYAAYGALQGTDAIVHFAFDGADWSVKPNFWMQQWTLCSPVMMGQFPAAALVFREGLVAEGASVTKIALKVNDLLQLKGTPLPQDAALDELRLADVPQGTKASAGNRPIDPLVHFVGRTDVRVLPSGEIADGTGPTASTLHSLDRKGKLVSAADRSLMLDFDKGVLLLDSPTAQGLVGDLSSKPNHETSLLEVSSKLVNACVLLVSLDGKPIKESKRMLLQVMSEEKPTDFRVEDLGDGKRRIANIGRDPWLVREIEGSVTFKTADAASLKITKLDQNGVKTGAATSGPKLKLDPKTVYYVIERN